MRLKRFVRPCVCMVAMSAVVGSGLFANRANAVESYYFDLNGSTAGFGTPGTGTTYDWDDPSTSPNTGLWSDGGTGAINTGLTDTLAWVQGSFPRFDGGTTGQNYTVTVSRDIQIAGMFNQLAGTTLNINAVGSGTLEIVGTGAQGIIGSAGSSTILNAPISGGATTILNPNNGGNVYLNAVNTYTGGTSLSTSATLIYFNNSSSFGTGTITDNITSTTNLFSPLLAQGGTTVTIPNNFAMGATAAANSGINFAADPNTPLVLTGGWNLGAKTIGIRNNGAGNSTVTLSGVISGAGGGVTVSSNSTSGVIFFSGANTYTGTTTVTGPGAPAGIGAGTAPVTLVLGAANTIASSSSVVMAGGVLDPNGINQSMPNTTLNIAGAPVSPATTFTSTIDYTFGAAEIDFANSSALTWATEGLLNLKSWNAANDKLRFGTNSGGLSSAQLAVIEADGGGLGTAHLDSNGFVVFGAVPGLPGDFNQNGVVDAADFVLWRNNVGQPAGTLPNDNTGVTIGSSQYNLWRSNFGNHSGAGSGLGAGSAVPEPTTIGLLLMGLFAIAARRQR